MSHALPPTPHRAEIPIDQHLQVLGRVGACHRLRVVTAEIALPDGDVATEEAGGLGEVVEA